MGGRGASSGISESGRKYGTEFTTRLKEGNIKFVKYNDANNAKDPLERLAYSGTIKSSSTGKTVKSNFLEQTQARSCLFRFQQFNHGNIINSSGFCICILRPFQSWKGHQRQTLFLSFEQRLKTPYSFATI